MDVPVARIRSLLLGWGRKLHLLLEGLAVVDVHSALRRRTPAVVGAKVVKGNLHRLLIGGPLVIGTAHLVSIQISTRTRRHTLPQNTDSCAIGRRGIVIVDPHA